MAFTDLTLEQMMGVIGSHTVERRELNASKRFWLDYIDTSSPELYQDIERKVLNVVLDELECVLSLAKENVWTRAYENANIRPFLWTLFSGKKGYVTQIADQGRGFDVQNVVRATIEGRRVKGVHYQNKGTGFEEYRMARHHLVNIDSTIGVGTNVNILHEY